VTTVTQPLHTAQSYMAAVSGARVQLPAEGLDFKSPASLEAAGVTWLEVASFDDPTVKVTANFASLNLQFAALHDLLPYMLVVRSDLFA
jgi:hypothetical protein